MPVTTWKVSSSESNDLIDIGVNKYNLCLPHRILGGLVRFGVLGSWICHFLSKCQMRRMACFFELEVLLVHLCWLFHFIFLQGEFDGVLREEAVAEALYQLGRSGSGTEQVFLNLTLSVSVTRSPLPGYILTWVGPYPLFSDTHSFCGGPTSQSHLVELGDKSYLCKC